MSETITPDTWDYQIPEQPVVKPRRRKLGVVLAVAALGIITGVIALVVHLHGSTLMSKVTDHDNYLTDTSLLEDSVFANINMKTTSATGQVSDVGCVPQEHRQFICNITWDDGNSTTADVTVSPDGHTWVSASHH